MNFAVFGLPRSGTTWAANWLTDSGAICLHDPLVDMELDELMAFQPERPWGISCTGSWMLRSFVDSLKCPILLLERDLSEIQESLSQMGVPLVSDEMAEYFATLPFPRIDYKGIFDGDIACDVWRYLRPDAPFDSDRHAILRQMNVQPNFGTIEPRRDVMEDFMRRLGG
jgi:hypothetical protein